MIHQNTTEIRLNDQQKDITATPNLKLVDGSASKPVSLEVPPEVQPPWFLAPGQYDFVHHSTKFEKKFNRTVAVIWFVSVDFDGKAVPDLANLGGQGGRGARRNPKPARHSKIVQDWRRLFPQQIKRLDQFPYCWINGKRLLVEVGTVTEDYRQLKTDEALHYSVIRTLIMVGE